MTERNDIPYGCCHCGCGAQTPIARKTSLKFGTVRGEPKRFIQGHGSWVDGKPVSNSRPCACGCGRMNRGFGRFVRGHQTAHVQQWDEMDGGYESPCWVWRGRRNKAGYGTTGREGFHLAHRWVYAKQRGAIADDLHLDHLCGVRECVNPSHLEPVTQAENNRRRPSKLTAEQRDEICQSTEPRGVVAEQYGVTPAYVYQLRGPMQPKVAQHVPDVDPKRLTYKLEDRGFSSECWAWTGTMLLSGYGAMGIGQSKFRAHRVSYVYHRGSVPLDMDLDHLCEQRDCINPDHLEPVTHQENMKRWRERRG